MALVQSPQIVTNGLVFYYDMGNPQKSWKGQPATNLLGYSDSLNGGSWSGYCAGNMNNVVYKTTDVVDPFGGYNATKITIDGNTSCGAAGTWGFLWGAGGLSAGVTYTASIYAMADRTTSFTLGINDSAGAGQTVTTSWQRFTFTYTTGATDRGLQVIRGAATSGIQIYFYGAQLEVGSYATPYISAATAATSRSNTQAVLDLTNNNTNTVNSLTYASDGTFSFNGSNSITVPFNPSAFTFNNEQTIIIWMKNQSPSSARRNPYNQAYAGAGTITHENDTGFNYFYGTGGGDNEPYTALTTAFSVVVGETAMICFTRNTSTVSCYKNGVFSNSMTNPYGAVVTGTNNITIGSGYAGGFGGSLYAVQLYNRSLTASEVQQNFNALRGRYGL